MAKSGKRRVAVDIHRHFTIAQMEIALREAYELGLLTAEAVHQLLLARTPQAPPTAEVPDALRADISPQHSPAQYDPLTEVA